MDSEACSTVSARPVRFNAKNTLNRVRSNKIKKIFFIFKCVLFEKNSVKHYSMTLYKLDEARLMT